MSEAVAAAPSGAPTSSAQTSSPTQTTGNTQGKSAPQGEAQGRASQTQGKDQTTPSTQEELEEIKLGSVSGKVPKELAQTIRQLQKGFTTSSQEAAAFRQILGNASPQQIAQLAQNKERFAEYLFQRTGIDPDQYSQARLARMLERQMMDPKQREAAEKADKDREELERFRQSDKERQEQEKTQAEQKMDVDLRNEIFTAWKESGLPPHPEFGAWMAAEMARAEGQGKSLSAKEAAARIKTKFDGLIKMIAPSLNPEQLEGLIGTDSLSKWREYDVKRITQKAPQASSSNASRPADSAASKPKKMMTEKEYREYWAKKAQ